MSARIEAERFLISKIDSIEKQAMRSFEVFDGSLYATAASEVTVYRSLRDSLQKLSVFGAGGDNKTIYYITEKIRLEQFNFQLVEEREAHERRYRDLQGDLSEIQQDIRDHSERLRELPFSKKDSDSSNLSSIENIIIDRLSEYGEHLEERGKTISAEISSIEEVLRKPLQLKKDEFQLDSWR